MGSFRKKVPLTYPNLMRTHSTSTIWEIRVRRARQEEPTPQSSPETGAPHAILAQTTPDGGQSHAQTMATPRTPARTTQIPGSPTLRQPKPRNPRRQSDPPKLPTAQATKPRNFNNLNIANRNASDTAEPAIANPQTPPHARQSPKNHKTPRCGKSRTVGFCAVAASRSRKP
jgi:hypothetical protein